MSYLYKVVEYQHALTVKVSCMMKIYNMCDVPSLTAHAIRSMYITCKCLSFDVYNYLLSPSIDCAVLCSKQKLIVPLTNSTAESLFKDDQFHDACARDGHSLSV